MLTTNENKRRPKRYNKTKNKKAAWRFFSPYPDRGVPQALTLRYRQASVARVQANQRKVRVRVCHWRRARPVTSSPFHYNLPHRLLEGGLVSALKRAVMSI